MSNMFKTTEVTSYEIISDNVLNQRLSFAYHRAAERVRGDMLELGCGTGRGIPLFLKNAKTYTAIDKNDKLTEHLSGIYPDCRFINKHIPPFAGIPDNSIDTIVTLQVIEHIENDHQFISEIHRVLKPNGQAVISTPNRPLSLSRNPWHVREYTSAELQKLLGKYFQKIDFQGVMGDEKVMAYHEENRRSVKRITRFDILNLQYRLPRQFLQIPYDILNRLNRNKLLEGNNELVKGVTMDNFSLSYETAECLDLFVVVEK